MQTIKPKKNPSKMLGIPGPGQPRGRQAGPTGQRPPRPGQGESRALTRTWARPRRRAARRARTSRVATAAAQGGAGEAGPERGRGRQHGVFLGEAMLTPQADGEEKRQGGSATAAGGAGDRASPRALHGEGAG